MKDSPCYQCADLDGPTDGASVAVCSACYEKWKAAWCSLSGFDFWKWVVEQRELQLKALGQKEAGR